MSHLDSELMSNINFSKFKKKSLSDGRSSFSSKILKFCEVQDLVPKQKLSLYIFLDSGKKLLRIGKVVILS